MRQVILPKKRNPVELELRKTKANGFENDNTSNWRRSGRSSRSFKVKNVQGLSSKIYVLHVRRLEGL